MGRNTTIHSSGRISTFIRSRGFGFLTEASGQEIFFHRSALRGALVTHPALAGCVVEFVAEPDRKTPGLMRAVEIEASDEFQLASMITRDLAGEIYYVCLERGFCFITAGKGFERVFCHRVDLGAGLEFAEQLKARRVKFDSAPDTRGLRALNVRPA